MPLNVRRFLALFFLVLVSFFSARAQTSGDVMRERVAKAKAFIAVRNYNAAIYELENIRRETSDPTVNGVINVLLMNSYLEQGDYKRAQDFLAELSKSKKPNAAANYLTAAGQVVKGAKNQLERYRALGLNVSDRNLPLEAVADIDKMRQTLETVVEQSKVLGKDKAQTANAMALLEEATAARGSLAKDDFDATRWKNEAADARELLANSRSVVINAVNDTPTETTTPNNNVAANTNNPVINTSGDGSVNPNTNPNDVKPVNSSTTNPFEKTNTSNTSSNQTAVKTETPKEEPKKTDDAQKTVAETNNGRTRRVETSENKPTETVAANTNSNSPLEVGSLIEYATQKVNPVYPQQAKTVRQTGVVKVELIIDEKGQVAAVNKLSGPALLKSAAEDAAKKWKFKPFLRDGQPVKATGFVSFNFNL